MTRSNHGTIRARKDGKVVLVYIQNAWGKRWYDVRSGMKP